MVPWLHAKLVIAVLMKPNMVLLYVAGGLCCLPAMSEVHM